jgi:hypothetical protein
MLHIKGEGLSFLIIRREKSNVEEGRGRRARQGKKGGRSDEASEDKGEFDVEEVEYYLAQCYVKHIHFNIKTQKQN